MSAHDKLAELARLFIGIKEERPNQGPFIRLFQEAVDCRSQGEPYCVGFVHYLLKQIDSEMRQTDPLWPGHMLYKTENSIKLYKMSPFKCRSVVPKRGFIMVWQKHEKGIPTDRGHCGIISNILDVGSVETVEGNTSGPKNQDQREGDGVWQKNRSITCDEGSLKVLGFLDPWNF